VLFYLLSDHAAFTFASILEILTMVPGIKKAMALKNTMQSKNCLQKRMWQICLKLMQGGSEIFTTF